MNIFKRFKKQENTKEINGKVYKVMDWGVPENQDKSWPLSGFERETPLSARPNN
jgi:hypothetical protein